MKCNLQYKIPSYILIVFHNLSGYDAHLFIKELAAYSTDGAKMGVIAKNKEDYISFSIKVEVDKYIDKNGIEKSKEIKLRFIDSFKFMSSILDSLVNNLARRGSEFFGFEEYSKNQYKLLIKKGICPYEYMTDWDKFKETKFPPREAFYSKLNMSDVGNEDYEHSNRVWKEFGLKHLGEYHDLYLKMDVILLANVFEAFRKVFLKNYGLDLAHFYTAPGLAWKACLKKTRIRLNLLLETDMLLMFERGIRGGITQSVNRWAEANNPYMGSEAFYSKLNMSGVGNEDYEHLNRVWKEFGLKHLGEYHDLYLKMDVILLANVFEAFRKVFLKNYGLDLAHFYTAPGLAWKACLKKTRIRLNLLLETDMLLMFERGIRGGITQSVNRWAKANNPYMGSEFHPNEKTNYLQYLDATIFMDGQCLNHYLPEGSTGLISNQIKSQN